MVKKREGKVVEQLYCSFMPTLYKVYALALAEKLKTEKKLEKKKLYYTIKVFRRKMETIDNVCIFNYMVDRQLERRGEKLVLLLWI